MLLDGIIKYQNFKDEFSNEFSNEINTNTHLFYVNFRETGNKFGRRQDIYTTILK